MKTWWRIIAGLGAGAANSFANGVAPKQIGFSLLLVAMGIVSHFSSTSDSTQVDGIKPAITGDMPVSK